MQTFSPRELPKVRKVGQRLGSSKPACSAGVPNLPNLPNVAAPTHAYTRTCAHVCTDAHTQARTHTHTYLYLNVGKVRKVRKSESASGFQGSEPLPNLGKVGNMATVKISDLRTLFRIAAPYLAKVERWSEADLRYLNDTIKAAIAAEDWQTLGAMRTLLDTKAGLALAAEDAANEAAKLAIVKDLKRLRKTCPRMRAKEFFE